MENIYDWALFKLCLSLFAKDGCVDGSVSTQNTQRQLHNSLLVWKAAAFSNFSFKQIQDALDSDRSQQCRRRQSTFPRGLLKQCTVQRWFIKTVGGVLAMVCSMLSNLPTQICFQQIHYCNFCTKYTNLLWKVRYFTLTQGFRTNTLAAK